MTRAAVRDLDADLEQVRVRLIVGAPVDIARLSGRAARALTVAAAAGAPSLPALDAAVAAADDLARRDHAVRVASAEARAVMAGLIALPVVAVPGLSALTGMPLWRFYLTPVGAVVGVLAALLAGAGLVIAHRMVTSVGRVHPPLPPVAAGLAAACITALLVSPLAALPVGLAAVWWRRRTTTPGPAPAGLDEVPELVATALTGGLSHGAALRLVAEQLPEHADDLRRAALAIDLGATPTMVPPLDRVGDVLTGARDWGAPAAPALRRVARQLRDDELARVMTAAERLPALLTFPTALCLLPACLLLAGAPLVAEGLRAATGG